MRNRRSQKAKYSIPLRGVIELNPVRIFLTIVFLAVWIPAQTPSPTPKAIEDAPPAASATPVANAAVKRWLGIDALAVSTRYRVNKANNGMITNNQNQFQVTARGRFKFDSKGKYSVYAAVGTGNSITGGWNNTGWGTGDPQSNLYLKQLYFNAKPVKWLELQIGGIGVNNGENTEITAYDNDVYMMGERVQVRRPKNLYFDEISVTYAFLGDNNRPNVFRRFRRLDESNFHQFLVRKQVNKVVSFSADYTFESGRDTLRQALKFKIPKGHILDVVLFENYQRIDPDRGYGFNIYGEKAVWKKLTLGGGFARIDRPMLNADRFPQGNRLYFNTNLKLTREFSLSSALTQAVGPLPSLLSPRTRFDLIFTYNILELLRKHKLL